MRQPSYERGCQGKANLGNKNYKKSADWLSKKHGRIILSTNVLTEGGTHLTTKIIDGSYAPILYTTGNAL